MGKRHLSKVFFSLTFVWTILILIFILLSAYRQFSEIEELALSEAKIGVNKDLAFRKWVANKGGVYAPISKETPPNPYLRMNNRDVNTTDGQQLTLINPAYALRQISESYVEFNGIKGHLTSLKLINPSNAPDFWEHHALVNMEKTRKDFYEITPDNHLRYIYPFFIEKQCLKCHSEQGYKIGDIRGAISVEIPLERYKDVFIKGIQTNGLILLAIWVLGLIAISNGHRSFQKHYDERINLYEQNLFSLVSLIEQRDNYTAGHGRRVGEYSRMIAAQMGLGEEMQEELFKAGVLHDIGKVAIPDSILLKPGRLEPIERSLIEEHVNASYELLKKVAIFASIAEIIRFHHERNNGSGYPLGLTGDSIPLGSQILAVADCFDAMTTNRIYKGRKTVQQAIEELNFSCDNLFRKDVVEAATLALADVKLDTIHSQRPSTLLEMERFSYFYKDHLTGLYSPGYLNFIFFEPDFNHYSSLIFITLHHMNRLNKTLGWETGDLVLKKYALFLQAITHDDPIIRFQGDDFIIFTKEPPHDVSALFYTPSWMEGYEISVSVKVFDMDGFEIESIENLHELLTKIAHEH